MMFRERVPEIVGRHARRKSRANEMTGRRVRMIRNSMCIYRQTRHFVHGEQKLCATRPARLTPLPEDSPDCERWSPIGGEEIFSPW
jgi:hypothetical protein